MNGQPYDGDDLQEMELAIYRGHGVSASAGLRQLRQAQADAADAQVAAMLRDGEG